MQIPHIRMQERAFVLVPALEILCDSADEIIKEKYKKCLASLKAEGKADGIEKLPDFDFPKAVENGTGNTNS